MAGVSNLHFPNHIARFTLVRRREMRLKSRVATRLSRPCAGQILSLSVGFHFRVTEFSNEVIQVTISTCGDYLVTFIGFNYALRIYRRPREQNVREIASPSDCEERSIFGMLELYI